MLGQGFELRPRIDPERRRCFFRIIVRIPGKTVGFDLNAVVETVAVGIEGSDGLDRGGIAAMLQVVTAVSVQGLGQWTFPVIAVLEMAPLAAAEGDLRPAFFHLAAAVAQGAMVQFAASLGRVDLQEIGAVALAWW